MFGDWSTADGDAQFLLCVDANVRNISHILELLKSAWGIQQPYFQRGVYSFYGASWEAGVSLTEAASQSHLGFMGEAGWGWGKVSRNG